MASVIRLLPKKKVERNVVPYNVLLDNVMRKRFNQAALTTSYFDLASAAVSSVVLQRGTVTTGRILALVLATLTVLLMEKIVFRTESRAYPTVAAEIRGKATSILTYIVLAAHLVSGWFYLHSFFVPHKQFFEVKHAQPSKLPAGIPESLALHRTTSWYVVNEQHLYLASFVVVLALASGVRYIWGGANILRLDPNEDGVKPLLRIKRRIQARAANSVVVWGALVFVHPLVFFMLRNRAMLPLLKLWIARRATDTIQLSGFKLVNVALPVLVLPLALLWFLSHEILMAYLTLGPVYRGKPISDSASADKNGTLVEGLGRNPINLSALTAWHELLIIAEHDQPRRKSIFNDVDGDRVIWDQIYKSFDKLIQSHITALTSPPPSKKNTATTNKKNQDHHKGQADWQAKNGMTSTAAILAGHTSATDAIDHRGDNNTHIYISSAPLNQIYKPESAFEKKLASFAKTLQSNSTTRAQKTRARLLAFMRKVYSYGGRVYKKFLATRPGSLFCKTVARNLAVKIQHPQTTSFALRGIARMITKSVSEDEYGFVQNSIVPALVSLDALAGHLEKIAAQPSIDETDVLVKQGVQKPNVDRANRLAGEVNGAFAEIIEAFGPYLESLGVSPAVQLRARRIASDEVTIEKTAWLSS